MTLGLLEPEDFKGDRYGYLTNQNGHFMLGFSLLSLYCFTLDKLVEYPSQTVSLLVVVGIYFLWWELMIQGWRKLDSIKDTFYFSLGTAPYLFISMATVIDKIFAFLLLYWAILLVDTLRS